jgi:hypothetical protein
MQSYYAKTRHLSRKCGFFAIHPQYHQDRLSSTLTGGMIIMHQPFDAPCTADIAHELILPDLNPGYDLCKAEAVSERQT